MRPPGMYRWRDIKILFGGIAICFSAVLTSCADSVTTPDGNLSPSFVQVCASVGGGDFVCETVNLGPEDESIEDPCALFGQEHCSFDGNTAYVDDPCLVSAEACYGDPTGGGPSGPPPGVDVQFFESLNPAEKALCLASPGQCITYGTVSLQASNWAKNTGLPGQASGPQDAVRHTYWSAKLSLEMGNDVSITWTNAHEYGSPCANETNMDLHNNRIGREIANQVRAGTTTVEQGVWDAYFGGKLTLNASCP